MQHRTQSVVVQVCLALLCAVGAGFSGDMLTRTTGHFSHHGRHARGTHLRGTRHSGRDTHSDHAQEVDVVRESVDPAQGDNRHGAVAILPQVLSFTVAWTDFGFVPVTQIGFVPSVAQLELPARAPPSVA